ncbi:myomegalin [Chanos chanos]|uniref:Myomegalin n=1 Tax=Chanos chanos TaxID=29144 RepID=A0A6J2V9X3_CHACN|nr:myomegalin-like [Chanos chanos]
MLDSKTKEVCRICARELCGNQRRWIFHPASKLSLQVLLSHALGREMTRDGRGEFACSKCAFMLDRMYRFDTVIARVEALSIERLQKLLQEKDRLRQCIGGLYRKNNADEGVLASSGASDSPVVDISALSEAKYSALLQEDFAYSGYESWAEQDSQEMTVESQHHHHHHHCQVGSEVTIGQRSRKCRGCAALRVADSDYEAVCKVPRKVGRSTSCGPSTRYSGSVLGSTEEPCAGAAPPPPDPEHQPPATVLRSNEPGHTSLSPASSVESLDTAIDVSQPAAATGGHPEGEEEVDDLQRVADSVLELSSRPGSMCSLDLTFSLLKSFKYRPIRRLQGSRIPLPVKPSTTSLEADSGSAQTLLQNPHAAMVCPVSLHLADMVSHSVQQDLQLDFAEMEDLWLDDYVQCGPMYRQKNLIEEQQSQLVQYENAAGQCVSELQKAQMQVQSLQAKIRESEASSKKLQQRLGEMECDLRSLQEVAKGQERTIQTLNDSLNTKDKEVSDLHRLTEEQRELLCSLKQQNSLKQLQVSGAEPSRLQAEVLELQASLFSAQLELQGCQRVQCQSQRREEDLIRANQRLQTDLQEMLQHRQEAEKHNHDLVTALQKAHSDLQQMEEKWKESEEERERERENREKTIRELRTSLQNKERLIQDYSELLDAQREPTANRDTLILKLKQRIQERDRALERAVDEKFECMEQRDAELRRLQLLVREKDRDLEKLRCVLSNNEETITSLEVLVRGKGLELEQVCEAWHNTQRLQREREEMHTRSLRERDTLISQLQTSLQTQSKEAEELRGAVLRKVSVASSGEVEELRSRVQLKERLFQELLADRNRQAKEHHAEVQDLLNAVSARDQYIKDSARRMGEVMSEQSTRVQELRRQLATAESLQGTALPPTDTQVMCDELQLALHKEREAQAELSALRCTLASHRDQIQSQALQLEALTRTIDVKADVIKDLQMQLVEPSDLPLLERLTQELQDLKESRAHQDRTSTNDQSTTELLVSMETRQSNFGDLTSNEEEDECNSEFRDSTEEEENSELTARSLATMQSADQRTERVKGKPSQDGVGEGQGLVEVKLLVEQKRAVERELGELKAQLEKAGFSSLSQMRKALFSLRSENEVLLGLVKSTQCEKHGQDITEEEEEEEREDAEETVVDVERCRPDDELCVSVGKRCASGTQTQHSRGKRRCTRPLSLDLGTLLSQSTQEDEPSAPLPGPVPLSPVEAGLRERTVRLASDLEQIQQESKELQERLMVSEATVQAQAEQIKDYRELLTETSVQQDSKQVQVDLQDLGYETCGRSENEAEREDTSSPEFDDLEMCTSLSRYDGGSEWWSGSGVEDCGKVKETDVALLKQLVEDLRAQLSRSQTVIRGLQSRVRTLSVNNGDRIPATPRKVNWGEEVSPAQSGAEEDEGWQSSDGFGSLPRPSRADKELQELMSRVASLEDELRKGKKQTVDSKTTNWSGKFDTLIQAQARELSNLRQRMREGRGVCHILTQHLGDTTKTFEELLRANDIDYYMGQSFREQLAQSTALAQRISTKISGRDQSDVLDDKTGHELLAIRLSKELQQKDKLIESLRSKLDKQQELRPDTPASSHALSVVTDQSDRTSFVSDEPGSTNEDLDLCSEFDVASEYGQEEATRRSVTDSQCHRGSTPCHPTNPPSISSSHSHQSSNTCPSMHGTPLKPMDIHAQTGYSGSQVKPLPGFPLGAHPQSDLSGFHPLSHHAFHSSPLGRINASPVLQTGPGLLESSALWDMSYGARPIRAGVCGDISSGSSGYQSANGHTGSDLMEEHLREIRSLRQRLEDSIRTNDRLRQQLEEKLATTGQDRGGAPTNIYIQGLDSVSQLSNELRAVKEENLALQMQLKQASRDSSKEAEHLREAVLSGRGRLKQAELEVEQWAEKCRRLQAEMRAQTQAMLQLKQEKQSSQESANRLQHEVNMLQQQLSESQRLVHTLQCELQTLQRVYEASRSTHTGPQIDEGKFSFDLQELQTDMRSLHAQLERQLSDRLDPGGSRPPTKRQLFHDPSPSPPVRDIGPLSPSSPPTEQEEPDSNTNDPAQSCRGLGGEAPDNSFACRNGRHVVGHVDDYSSLQQQLLEAKVLIRKMEAALQTSSEHSLQEGCVRNLLTSTKTLRQILEELGSLLRMFWRAALPSTEASAQPMKKEQSLKEEVISLRQRVTEQEQALREAMESLRSSNRTKDSMEHFIVSQLSRTRDVLKKARTNLELKAQDAPPCVAPLLVGVS